MLSSNSDSGLPHKAAELLARAGSRFPAETPDPLKPVLWADGDSVRYAQLIEAKRRLWLVLGRIASDPDTGLARTVELTVTGWDHDEEADVRVLAAVKVAPVRNAITRRLAQRDAHDLIVALLTETAELQTREERAPTAPAFLAVGAREALASRPRRRGRPPLPVDLLQRVAHIYLEEVAAGAQGLHDAVGTRLSRELGREIPGKTARDWIYKARRKGFLPKTSRGRQSLQLRPTLDE